MMMDTKTPAYSTKIVLHLEKCCFSCSWNVGINSHRGERITITENK